ncbi:hypothetical protein PybrP1_010429 [[Pythium] brassicae (nom. inval.)]|nr:hypothetical protein PybrP1_010429 [[Pythium] brassicae (nom. inval.)]
MTAPLLVALKATTTIAAFAMCLSPIPDIRRICQLQSTENVSVLPLVSLWGNSFLWLLYGYLAKNFFPIVATSVFGCLTALVYITVYFRRTTQRRYVAKLFCAVLLGLLFVMLYAVLGLVGVTGQARAQVRDIVGYIAVAVNIVLYASPLETVREVVRTKSAKTLPISMCLVAAINCSLWMVCGVVDSDLFVLTPNVIGVTLSIIQVVLYHIYHPKRRAHEGEFELELGRSRGDLAPGSTCSKDGSHVSMIHSPKDDFSAFPFIKAADWGLEFAPSRSPRLAPPNARM